MSRIPTGITNGGGIQVPSGVVNGNALGAAASGLRQGIQIGSQLRKAEIDKEASISKEIKDRQDSVNKSIFEVGLITARDAADAEPDSLKKRPAFDAVMQGVESEFNFVSDDHAAQFGVSTAAKLAQAQSDVSNSAVSSFNDNAKERNKNLQSDFIASWQTRIGEMPTEQLSDEINSVAEIINTGPGTEEEKKAEIQAWMGKSIKSAYKSALNEDPQKAKKILEMEESKFIDPSVKEGYEDEVEKAIFDFDHKAASDTAIKIDDYFTVEKENNNVPTLDEMKSDIGEDIEGLSNLSKEYPKTIDNPQITVGNKFLDIMAESAGDGNPANLNESRYKEAKSQYDKLSVTTEDQGVRANSIASNVAQAKKNAVEKLSTFDVVQGRLNENPTAGRDQLNQMMSPKEFDAWAEHMITVNKDWRSVARMSGRTGFLAKPLIDYTDRAYSLGDYGELGRVFNEFERNMPGLLDTLFSNLSSDPGKAIMFNRVTKGRDPESGQVRLIAEVFRDNPGAIDEALDALGEGVYTLKDAGFLGTDKELQIEPTKSVNKHLSADLEALNGTQVSDYNSYFAYYMAVSSSTNVSKEKRIHEAQELAGKTVASDLMMVLVNGKMQAISYKPEVFSKLKFNLSETDRTDGWRASIGEISKIPDVLSIAGDFDLPGVTQVERDLIKARKERIKSISISKVDTENTFSNLDDIITPVEDRIKGRSYHVYNATTGETKIVTGEVVRNEEGERFVNKEFEVLERLQGQRGGIGQRYDQFRYRKNVSAGKDVVPEGLEKLIVNDAAALLIELNRQGVSDEFRNASIEGYAVEMAHRLGYTEVTVDSFRSGQGTR